jgi:hypothetical protein
MLDISYLFNNNTLKSTSVLKPKYSLSIRNKCAYLLESSDGNKKCNKLKGVDLGYPKNFPIIQFFLSLHHGIVMSKYIICQSFKKFHHAVFSIAYPKYRCHFQQYFSYIIVASFIGGGNQSTWRKQRPVASH